jgi:predicted aconitase with swiveling domain
MALIAARTLVPGDATATALVLDEPLSFWGGVDPATGRLIDVHHPQAGASLTGVVLVMPSGRGSSSSSYVLAEAIRAGTGPAAVVLGEPDGIVALGALVAAELYGTAVPVVVPSREDYATLGSGALLSVTARPAGAQLAPGAPGAPTAAGG